METPEQKIARLLDQGYQHASEALQELYALRKEAPDDFDHQYPLTGARLKGVLMALDEVASKFRK